MDRFEDSSEATAHMDKIRVLLNDKRLTEWIDSTDAHFFTEARRELDKARAAWAALENEVETAV